MGCTTMHLLFFARNVSYRIRGGGGGGHQLEGEYAPFLSLCINPWKGGQAPLGGHDRVTLLCKAVLETAS